MLFPLTIVKKWAPEKCFKTLLRNSQIKNKHLLYQRERRKIKRPVKQGTFFYIHSVTKTKNICVGKVAGKVQM